MAAADTARLIAQLILDDKNFTKGLSNAQKRLGDVESTAFRVGQNIGRGTQAAISNVAKIGVVAAGGIAVAVKTGLDDLAELENAVTSVDGAISQLGLTGQITGKQVADWANGIERDIDAAFDDKAITQAATTLLRFGKVTPKTLKPALEVVADLAAKTGDVESAAELLSKALADPAKAAGRLTRVGIILTDQQKEQIKTMTEAGDVAGAQAVLLDAVAKSTAGAAKAMAGPYQDALNKTNDAVEDARKALAIGFLPIITKVADKLSTIAADPKALASIEKFGKTLAGGLDSLIATAERLPWGAIGTSMELAGMGAKAVLDAFVSLPPWVQTAVLTGWGLNKLTGGALGGIVGELGKGLIKGVLGMNAGVVIIKAGVVNGAGGVPTSATGGVSGKVAAVGQAAQGVVILGLAQGVAAEITGAVAGPEAKQIQQDFGGGPVNIFGPFERLMRALTGDLRSPLQVISGTGEKLVGKVDTLHADAAQQATRQNISNERLEAIRGYNAAQTVAASNLLRSSERNESIARDSAARGQAAAFAIRDKVGSSGSLIQRSVDAARTVAAQTTVAARAAGQQAAAAIRDKDLSVAVTTVQNTRVNVSVRDTISATTTQKQYQRYIS